MTHLFATRPCDNHKGFSVDGGCGGCSAFLCYPLSIAASTEEQSVVLSPPHGIGSSNPAVSFSLARTSLTQQSIAHQHNRYAYPRRNCLTRKTDGGDSNPRGPFRPRLPPETLKARCRAEELHAACRRCLPPEHTESRLQSYRAAGSRVSKDGRTWYR